MVLEPKGLFKTVQGSTTIEDLPWIGIHPVLNFPNACATHLAEIGTFGQKPPNYAMMILVGPPFRRTVGMSKLQGHPGFVCKD